MKITEKQYNKLKEKVENLELLLNGGKGSGNFGHAGRPGEVGGSASSGLSGILGERSYEKELEHYQEEALDNLGFSDIDKMTEKDWGKVHDEMARLLERENKENPKQLKEQKLAEIRDKNRQKREAEVSKAKAEREEHIKQIDKIIGSEKITEGETKAEDDKNYKKLEKDVREIKRILAKEKSRENFGQEEIRKLKDKYSDYMSGNWSTVGRFMGLIRDLEDWADNYQNY